MFNTSESYTSFKIKAETSLNIKPKKNSLNTFQTVSLHEFGKFWPTFIWQRSNVVVEQNLSSSIKKL
jgi:hypothetical protein